MRVGEENCHPFQNGRYLWMHNGSIEGFSRIKRRLRESLPDPLYDAVQGTTDSEHAFALFLSFLADLQRFIASEPFTAARAGWVRVPPNHTLTVGPDLRVQLALLERSDQAFPSKTGA